MVYSEQASSFKTMSRPDQTDVFLLISQKFKFIIKNKYEKMHTISCCDLSTFQSDLPNVTIMSCRVSVTEFMNSMIVTDEILDIFWEDLNFMYSIAISEAYKVGNL